MIILWVKYFKYLFESFLLLTVYFSFVCYNQKILVRINEYSIFDFYQIKKFLTYYHKDKNRDKKLSIRM